MGELNYGIEYFKDFNGWNVEKQHRHKKNPTLYFHQREVWWCALGVNIGFEQDGKNANYSRPVVILKTFSTNACLVVPLTSQEKKGLFYFDVGTVAGRQAKANLSQIRFVDKRRLVNKVDTIDEEIFEKLRSAIIQLNLS